MKKIIHWFRQDLRLLDNPSLTEATKNGEVLPIYILDDENSESHKMGAASRLWLHHSLKSLDESLGGALQIYAGNPQKIIPELVEKHNIEAVYWNRCYEPWRIDRDKKIKGDLLKNNIETESFNGSLLWEPWEISKKDGTPYKVFTPFYRKGCLEANPPREPLPKPKNIKIIATKNNPTKIADLNLLPNIPWDKELIAKWNVGEDGAREKVEIFLNKNIHHYKEGRNLPAKNHTSQLSPYLHFGEISPNQIWYSARMMEHDKNVDNFCTELGWREFSFSLLYYNPDMMHENLQKKFIYFPWHEDAENLKLWQQGKTGIPIVDAGMRELWQTGFMHNRVRMIVGSFLVKNLLMHWHNGEEWFWDCLLDADLANNSAGWQWIAGCGADAAPYFRIFNPVTQGQRFDAEGEYTRKYVPELKDMPDKYLFNPWEAPPEILQQANITLGKTYPKPIVDLKKSRERALQAFQKMKEYLPQ